MTKNTFWLLLGVTLTLCAGIFAMEALGRPRTVQLRIDGSHCEGCLMNVRGSLLKVPGVKSVEVKFVEQTAERSAPSENARGDNKSGDSATTTSEQESTPSDNATAVSAPIDSATPDSAAAEKPIPAVESAGTRTAVAKLTVDSWNSPSDETLVKAVEKAGKRATVLP